MFQTTKQIKYPVVILLTDHQIKTGETVPTRIDPLVGCPLQRVLQPMRGPTRPPDRRASAKMSGMVTVAAWSLWRKTSKGVFTSFEGATHGTVAPLEWRMHSALRTRGLLKHERFLPLKEPKNFVITHQQNTMCVFVSYGFPMGMKTNGLVPRRVQSAGPQGISRVYVGPIKMAP